MVVVGAGVAICDRRDKLIFKSSNHFAVRSRKAAELLALIDVSHFEVEKGHILCDDYLIYQYVMSTIPGSSEIAAFVNQVTRLERNFAACV